VWAGSLIAGGFFAATFAGASAQEALPEFPTVSTVAGSGVAGLADGPASSAQFLFPTGVAVDARGNIYVADAGAQRIKEVARNGTVRTIAGGGATSFGGLWVDGGYADGPAAAARFSVPLGIAVDGTGAVYVADSANHAIRKIKDGVVSTVAGDPSRAGDAVGALKDARFRRPDALAFDRAGNLYVADLQDGIREITTDGQVVAVDIKVDRPTGIAIYEDGPDKYISIADYQGIVTAFPHRTPLRIPSRPVERADLELAAAEGGAPLGYPCNLVMLDKHSMVYTDTRTHTIRLYSDLQTRIVAGRSYDDIENSGGGYRDGQGGAVMFYSPFGIARASDGSFIVTDAGNRRLRRVSAFDMRHGIDPQLEETPELDRTAYNIVLVGNSYAWFDTDFRNSIAGFLERDLTSLRPGGKAVRVTIVTSPGLTLPAAETLFTEYLSDSDFTVLLLNSLMFPSSWPDLFKSAEPHNAEVVARTTASLRRMDAALTHPKDVLAIIHPWPWEFSESETTYHRLYEKIDQEWLFPVPSFHQMWIDSVHGAGLPLVDFWTVLAEHEASANRVPYFGSANPHFSRAGRELLARTIADWLIARHPWNESH